jgi:mono/diheme cytochrome c family protein
MNRSWKLATAGVVLLLAVAAARGVVRAQAHAQNDQRGAGDSKNGQHLFTSSGCYQCHGRVAQGGAAGPRLAPRPMPAASFARYVRHPTGQMPPYTPRVLSDKDLDDLYAFLLTIPEPRPAAAIPLLNQ